MFAVLESMWGCSMEALLVQLMARRHSIDYVMNRMSLEDLKKLGVDVAKK